MWTCRNCQNEVDDEFIICWYCSHNKDGILLNQGTDYSEPTNETSDEPSVPTDTSLGTLKDMVKKDSKKNDSEYYRSAKRGIVTFCVVHACYEIFIVGALSTLSLVMINYFFSVGILVLTEERLKNEIHPLFAGLLVSALVFLIRLALGAIGYGMIS